MTNTTSAEHENNETLRIDGHWFGPLLRWYTSKSQEGARKSNRPNVGTNKLECLLCRDIRSNPSTMCLRLLFVHAEFLVRNGYEYCWAGGMRGELRILSIPSPTNWAPILISRRSTVQTQEKPKTLLCFVWFLWARAIYLSFRSCRTFSPQLVSALCWCWFFSAATFCDSTPVCDFVYVAFFMNLLKRFGFDQLFAFWCSLYDLHRFSLADVYKHSIMINIFRFSSEYWC